ncbi:MAG TPA: hypothetical protein VJA21_34270, partial [Verrucomicrobiae bacterium]
MAVAIGLVGVLAARGTRRADRLLAQLRAQGEKLTFRELTGGGSPIANPAPQVVVSVANALTDAGYSPWNLDFSTYSQPGRMRVAWKQGTVPDRRPGKTVKWEELADHLRQKREPLKALREVLAATPPEWGRRTNHTQPLMSNTTTLKCARWLSAEAISELHAQELELAVQNVEALGALARANTLDYSLFSENIRIMVAQMGLWVTWHACGVESWSDQQLERLQRAWEGLDVPGGLERGLLGERAWGIAMCEQVRRSAGKRLINVFWSSPQGDGTFKSAFNYWVVWPAYQITSWDADELFYLEAMTSAIDDARQIRAHRPWDQAKSKADYAAKIKQISGSPIRWRYAISSIILPHYASMLQNGVRAETLRQLTLTAIAIRRYQLCQGLLPPELASLTPQYLKTPTYDPMSGGSLQYRPGQNGDFLLYSV